MRTDRDLASMGLFVIVALPFLAIMMGLVFVAMADVGRGLLELLPTLTGSHDVSAGGHAVGSILRGLELLFLAPVGYLIVLGLTRYTAAMVAQSGYEEARGLVSDLKALVVSLMIGVVATDLVGRAITAEGMSYRQSITGSLLIVVLAFYFAAIEKVKH